MGLFQVLGLHHNILQYDSAEDMLKAFSQNEGVQWRGFEDFITADQELHRSLIDGDVDTFAHIYNGNAKVYKPLLIKEGWFGYR